MKFNKSEIMKTAWTIYRNLKIAMSEALKRAWRIERIDNALFYYDMKSRQSWQDRENVSKLSNERYRLMHTA